MKTVFAFLVSSLAHVADHPTVRYLLRYNEIIVHCPKNFVKMIVGTALMGVALASIKF